MEKIMYFIIAVLIAFGLYWLIWQLWMFVVPAICTSCAENVTTPDYWVFVGGLVLINIIGSMLFKK